MDDLDSAGYDLDNLPSSGNAQDVSARRLGTIQGILSRLLWDESLPPLLDATMVRKQSKNLDPSDNELSTMKRIYQHLKPYMVYDGPKHPKRLQYRKINLIMLGNQALRLCGYHKFCQQYCPVVSAGSLYTLSMNAPALYELLHKKVDMRSIGVTSTPTARQNKHGVFSAIFDMDEVTKACTKNGTEFIFRMDVTPAFDTLLFGKTVKPRQQSMYEKRLKATSSDFDTTSMPTNSIHDHDLDTIGKAISLAEKERDRLTKAKRDTTKQLDSTRRAMKKSTIVNHPSTTNTSKGKGN
ncbi:hypothetical protein DM01DRAFT_24840 [Hesseltinella vesiculosa]|uniref:Uncharacterized protein n=1 Tax=Hesseltinella vesiculosa TaxID=101127 RepID=A0A1X2G8D3_9FUNG|nr:hypothetical protein DM01DRAFT_24840 [Hesseltinella vesiculosa]